MKVFFSNPSWIIRPEDCEEAGMGGGGWVERVGLAGGGGGSGGAAGGIGIGECGGCVEALHVREGG